MAEEIGRGNKLLKKFANNLVAEVIGGGNEIILSKIGWGIELRKFAKIVVAEEIGWVNEIILCKIGRVNEPRKLGLG